MPLACSSPAASSTKSARALATWSSWPSGAFPPWATRWSTQCLEFGIARSCLGLGESGNFPAAIKTVAEWFPQSERSLATGIFNSGANLGAILAPLIVPWVTIHYGWHAAFLVTGVFSAPWIALVPQVPQAHRPPHTHRRRAAPHLPGSRRKMGPSALVKLLGYRQTWAFAIAKFLTDPVWWFFLFWLPVFLQQAFHLDLSHLGLPLIIVYNASAIGSVGGGWLPHPFRRLGLSHPARALPPCSSAPALWCPFSWSTTSHSEWIAIALLSLAAAAHQGWSANLFTTASDMFPRSAVGSVTGIGGMAGSVGGFFWPSSPAISCNSPIGTTRASSSLLRAPICLPWLIIVSLAPGLKKVEFLA